MRPGGGQGLKVQMLHAGREKRAGERIEAESRHGWGGDGTRAASAAEGGGAIYEDSGNDGGTQVLGATGFEP